VALCGGFGNVQRFLDAARRVDPTFTRHHNFQTAEATRERLERSGFTDIRAWLSPAPTRFDPGQPFEAFLETVCLRPNLADVPEAKRKPFVQAVAGEMGEPLLDYVRLNFVARRATS
jgi:hypothetical protein